MELTAGCGGRKGTLLKGTAIPGGWGGHHLRASHWGWGGTGTTDANRIIYPVTKQIEKHNKPWDVDQYPELLYYLKRPVFNQINYEACEETRK